MSADGVTVWIDEAGLFAETGQLLDGAGGFWCPECVAGKHVNCNGQAFDPANDLIVDCSCTHGGGQ